jgi:23S rRNA (cytidine1920-2'-O)/16S rRNA (cytidine1409-2'-O)-methyltransferase
LKNGLRLDALLVERGLAASRERARALILAGDVRVNGQPVTKAGTAIARDAEVTVAIPDHPYVGRGGLKLAHALDTFAIPVAGRQALDIGASTGGFTDVLLQRGAARVAALDVGHGQLDWKIRSDPRVDVIEIITIDVSFISLRHILPVVPPLLREAADVIVLVKPQFEAGRSEVGTGGIVRDAAVQVRVVQEVTGTADALGLRRAGLTESPIAGMEGNREFLLHLRQNA